MPDAKRCNSSTVRLISQLLGGGREVFVSAVVAADPGETTFEGAAADEYFP